MYALVDCNNFFVSCERLFNPKLSNVPVIVLSSNDGCAVSRSNEAKALGIPMGAPYFKYKDIIEKHNVQTFSSNFELYGDMSHRIMTTLNQFAPRVEIYSIDEAFLHLKGIKDLHAHGENIRTTVGKWTGIPVSVGIAPTKTLAKIAGDFSKKKGAVVVLDTEEKRRYVLATTQIEDIWGIGRKLAPSLRLAGIGNALQLTQAKDGWIRQKYSVTMLKKVKELRGIPCYSEDSVPADKKAITVSRSFGKPITTIEPLKEAVASFIAKGASKLRKQNSVARVLYVYIRTNKHAFRGRYYSNYITRELPYHTDDTQDLMRRAHEILQEMFIPNLRYKKAGIMLMDFSPKGKEQRALFDTRNSVDRERNERLQKAIDTINHTLKKEAVIYGAQGLDAKWKSKSDRCSPRYTTKWDDIPKLC